MPIFDQGYQHWTGRTSAHAWRWLAVTRQGVRLQTRRRRTKWLVAMAFVPALMLGTVLALWGLLEQKSSLLAPFMFLVQALPDEVRNGPKAFRPAVWTYAFNTFFGIETFFAMLLVLAVGPDLVSQDLRFNAVPLYLSRPMRRLDYFLGKLGVIATFLGAVSVGPAVVAYLIGLAFSLDAGVLRDTWHLLAGSVVYGVVLALSAGTLMLAISSMSRNSRLVGATWVVLWLVSNFSSEVLRVTVKRDWTHLVSYTANLDRLRDELLDVPAARKTFLGLWEAGQKAREELERPRLPFFRNRRRRNPPPPDRPPPILTTPDYLTHPWAWSAGVLAALFLASGATLATRVKSLDRLK